MTPKKILTALATTVALSLGLTMTPLLAPALADNESMSQGFAEYNAGNYNEALGHLQGSLSTDFNNAKLHYYLANTYIHLKQKDAGIREFRIAYALEPDKEVGKFAKQALDFLGADGDGKSKDKDAKTADQKPPTDPVMDKVTAALQEQADKAKIANRAGTDQLANDANRHANDQLDRAKSDMLKDMSYYRKGRLIQLPLPDDALKQLDTLKHLYDTQKNAYLDEIGRHSDEVQKSADNLTGLLNDKGKAGSPKLQPVGTNLYVRNYKNEQGTATAATAGTQPKSSAPPK